MHVAVVVVARDKSCLALCVVQVVVGACRVIVKRLARPWGLIGPHAADRAVGRVRAGDADGDNPSRKRLPAGPEGGVEGDARLVGED